MSFQSKADLLLDLGRIEDEEYKRLKLFMEIRNQFIHNIEIDTFLKASEKVNAMPKRLLETDLGLKNKFEKLRLLQDDLEVQATKEELLTLGFQKLYIDILETLVSQHEKIREDVDREIDIEAKSRFYHITERMMIYMDESIDEFGKKLEDILNKNFGSSFEFTSQMSNYLHRRTIEKTRNEFPDLPEPIDKVNNDNE